jgi:hypothetical protein
MLIFTANLHRKGGERPLVPEQWKFDSDLAQYSTWLPVDETNWRSSVAVLEMSFLSWVLGLHT